MKLQNTPVAALMVHNQETPLVQLRLELASQGVETYRARSCRHAKSFLERAIQHPQVLFTDVVLSDGTWVDMLAIARDIRPPVEVIVVSNQLDPRIYLDALGRGAFDFIVPPFEAPKVDHVLRCATARPNPKSVALAKSA